MNRELYCIVPATGNPLYFLSRKNAENWCRGYPGRIFKLNPDLCFGIFMADIFEDSDHNYFSPNIVVNESDCEDYEPNE